MENQGPYARVNDLITALRENRVVPEQFSAALTLFASDIARWEGDLNAVSIPHEEYPEATLLMMEAFVGIDLFKKSLNELKTFVEAKDVTNLDRAQNYARDGQKKVEDLLKITQANQEYFRQKG
ncbi:MAG: hypothetical protein HYU64_15875 [Armatimonadetes bacterium]|nr:hypothetical protein [Armatimonadota bacterium]